MITELNKKLIGLKRNLLGDGKKNLVISDKIEMITNNLQQIRTQIFNFWH